MAAMEATTTKRSAAVLPRGRDPRRPAATGPDRLTVVLLTLAGFLALLALLAGQLGSGATTRLRPIATIRRVYETRVIETVVGGAGGSSVTQSSSSTGSYGSSAPATTRTS